jgi:hypothetical protein
MNTVFDKQWFSNPKTQRRLLWLLNHSRYFRKDMGIQDCDLPFSEKIVRIAPNSFTWQVGENELMTDFRTHNKFGKRLYYEFLPIWNIAHEFDMKIANKWFPKLNLGFDTLTEYPAAGANSPVDGTVLRWDASSTWQDVRDGAGTQAWNSKSRFFYARSSRNVGSGYEIARAIFCFDTSAIGEGKNITEAVLSLYGSSKRDEEADTPTIDIFLASPDDTDTLAASDYGNIGTTSQTGSAITYAGYSATEYNAFTFNATGIGNISLTGISKFGSRDAKYDAADVSPNLSSNNQFFFYGYFADEPGTTKDPKLVVTYSAAATSNFLMFM